MRISTVWAQQQAINQINANQVALSNTQMQLSSGQKLLSPADDPAGAARALDLTSFNAALDQYNSNIDTATARLGLEDGALAQATTLLQSVRTLALEGLNATQSDASRQDIATQINQQLQQLVQIGNSQDANGEYLFAGNRTRTQPFTQDANGNVGYAGDQGSRSVALAPGQTVATGDPGSSVFMNVPSGNGSFAVTAAAGNSGSAVVGATSVANPSAWTPASYTLSFTTPDTWQATDAGGAVVASGSYSSGGTIAFNGITLNLQGTPAAGDSFSIAPSGTQSTFSSLKQIADALNTGADTPTARAAQANTINAALQSLDQALQTLGETRAKVGARENMLASQKTANGNISVQVQSTLSSIQDVDFPSAISQLNLQMTALQAAQQVYTKVQGLSLFNYIQ